jgi:two-component system chemotaxis response regulator CheB
VLAAVLGRCGPLSASNPTQGEPLRSGHVYVAPPDWHLLVDGDHVRLGHGPRENGFRPAIDAMFRSVARSRGSSSIGVVLSGLLRDGTSGLAAIKAAGGIAIVQEPGDALFSSMPLSAIARVEVDAVLDAHSIASRLAVEVAAGTGASHVTTEDEDGHRIQDDLKRQEQGLREGQSSVFTCPDCGGVLWERSVDRVLGYRCHVGHQYSMEGMLDRQSDELESALWTAVRALEERASFLRRLVMSTSRPAIGAFASRYEDEASVMERQADVVRRLLLSGSRELPSLPREEADGGQQQLERD